MTQSEFDSMTGIVNAIGDMISKEEALNALRKMVVTPDPRVLTDDAGYASEETFPEGATAQQWNQAETLYAFCGWLTTREEATVMSASRVAAPVVERIMEFCVRHRLDVPRAGWFRGIVPPELQQPKPEA